MYHFGLQGIKGDDGQDGIDGNDADEPISLDVENNKLLLELKSGVILETKLPKIVDEKKTFGGIVQASTTLLGQRDTNISNPIDDDILQYNTITKRWINVTLAELLTQAPTVVTDNYVLLSTDITVIFNITSLKTATLPDPTGNIGKTFSIVNKYTSTQDVKFSRNINGSSIFRLLPAENLTIMSDGTEYLIYE